MPTTRKKVIKTVYKDNEDESEGGDFSDSGSEAEIPEQTSDEEEQSGVSSSDEFKEVKKTQKKSYTRKVKKENFTKSLYSRVNKQFSADDVNEEESPPVLFSVKDLSEKDKLLPSFLNLSESDSSDDESPKEKVKQSNNSAQASTIINQTLHSDDEKPTVEYKDVFSNNLQDDGAEVAKRTYLELEQHKNNIEQTKMSIQKYSTKIAPNSNKETSISDLLALGGDVALEVKPPLQKKGKTRKKNDSDSDVEDWEEVNEAKGIPQQGLQLVVDFPDACRKKKTVDVEMMMKRRINRVKKEYQVHMHKVHVLCWIGHGNYISKVLNDQEVMAATLSLVPSKECYPGERVDMKYVEQITTWFKDKLTLKQDKNEHKYKPKAPPLKEILLNQIKSKTVSTKKNLVLVFVAMLRALGLQCRIMLNFKTLPIKPPSSELCSLSTKQKDQKPLSKPDGKTTKSNSKTKTKLKSKETIPQLDGLYDYSTDDSEEFENILQVDGNNDTVVPITRSTRSNRHKKEETTNQTAIANDKLVQKQKKMFAKDISPEEKNSDMGFSEDSSPPKRPRKRSPRPKENKTNVQKSNKEMAKDKMSPPKRGRKSPSPTPKINEKEVNKEDILPAKRARKSPSSLTKNETSKELENKRNTRRENLKDCSHVPEETKTKITRSRQKNVSTENNKPQLSNTTTATSYQNELKNQKNECENDNLSPLKRACKSPDRQISPGGEEAVERSQIKPVTRRRNILNKPDEIKTKDAKRNYKKQATSSSTFEPPKIIVTEDQDTSKYFGDNKSSIRIRSRSNTTKKLSENSGTASKTRTKSAPGSEVETSKYFKSETVKTKASNKKLASEEDALRVSHRDLSENKKSTTGDVTKDLVKIIKSRVKEAKEISKVGLVKGKIIKQESDDDSDFLPEEAHKQEAHSDDDFKPAKITHKSKSPRASTSRSKIDRRVLSTDTENAPKNKSDVWCEIYVEELEQWISVDVIKAKVHCVSEIYNRATHPVCYIVGWDNNNYLKDLTRRYVPHWNTVTRKLRTDAAWWLKAIQPWLGPKTARDKEEDEGLDRLQLEAPLPTVIAEYKNHPLYALKRHILKFEAIYPPDAPTLGFVRKEPVYSRDCVYTCMSRDKWLKEAKVVRLGEKPYKIVKARPKWDKLSNKCITDKPLEVFGPWQVDDYEPPEAENGMVPRNAYGNVELFKPCMLPKGTVHLRLPGLNKVARNLNIDCAPAMTGFDFNGGWSHPVYDGFVVCKEFEELITEAWIKEQEAQERREQEKIEARVYGNWKKLIKGLFIRERLKDKYGFENPSEPETKKKAKGPRLVCKKK